MGKIIEMAMSTGLRRNRRSSRSMMGNAPLMCASLLPAAHRKGAIERRRFLQGVAQLVTGVVDEYIVERCALYGQRMDCDAFLRRGVQQCHRGSGTVLRCDPIDVILAGHAFH